MPALDTLAIDPTRTSDGSEEGSRTLASAIFVRLRAEILSCRIPPGEKLNVSNISRRFDVSLAAVREALSRLVADGLVIAQDQRGFRVAPLSLADLTDLTQTRIEVECIALRRSIELGGDDWRERVRAAWDELQEVPRTTPEAPNIHNETWSVRHGRFHAALVSACGLNWLLRFRGTLYEQSERYRRMALAMGPTGRDIDREHGVIVEAALAGDADRACRELAMHLERTATAIAEAHRA